MGTLKNFRQLRAIPQPVGAPAYSFRRWEFGNMRPCPTQMYSGVITDTTINLVNIFIPKNTWAYRHMVLSRASVLWLLEDHSSGPTLTIQQYYQLDSFDPVLVAGGSYHGFSSDPLYQQQQRQLIYDEPYIYDTFVDNSEQPLWFADDFPGGQFLPLITGADTFDNSIDHNIKMLVTFTGTITGDSVRAVYGRSWIEAPLQLNRLPR